MKKCLCAALFVLTFFSANAQFSGGVKGGVNFSKVKSEYLITDSETGYYGGLFATYAFNEMYAIQPELYYSHQAGNTAGFDYSFDYVAIPVLFRIRFAPVNVYAGAHFGFLMNVEGPDVDEDDFKGTALSATAGMGYEFPFGLELGGRYVHGLSDISNNELIQDVHFRMWELYAAFRLFGR